MTAMPDILQSIYSRVIGISKMGHIVGAASLYRGPKIPSGNAGAGADVFEACGNLSQQLSIAGVGNTNDTTEDVLFSYSLAANSFDQDGRGLNIFAWGTFANNAHSKHARLRIGASDMVVDSGAYTTAALTPWALEATVFAKGTNTQTGFGNPIVGTVHGGVVLLSGTETATGNILIEVTGQTGTAAANDILCNGLIVTMMN